MNLRHFTNQKLEKIHSVAQNDNNFPYKPRGLWVSDESDYGWKEWCAAEEFGEGRFVYEYEIVLNDDHNILHIPSAEDLLEFTETFKESVKGYGGIDWGTVANEFQGIIITPYLWSCRFDPNWYYGWDCASGCIWDATAISQIKEVQ